MVLVSLAATVVKATDLYRGLGKSTDLSRGLGKSTKAAEIKRTGGKKIRNVESH